MPVSFENQNTKRIEFGRRGDANEMRDEIPPDARLESDDGREKTVKIDTSKLSGDELRRLEGEAAVSRDDATGDMHGQAALTDAERKRLDFTDTTVIEARTAKASLLGEGVSDWTAYFDPSLTTSEMADIARSTQASGGERLDTADSQRAQDRRMADAHRQVQSQASRRAREGCEEGFEEACDQLVEEFGVDRAEAERLLRQQQAARPGAGISADGGLVDTTVLRAGAHGRFLHEPPEPAPTSPGYRSGTTGRYVGYEIDQHNGKRSPNTGRIKSLGPAEPIGKDEQVTRWGDPDGPNSDPTNGGGRTDGAMFDALYRDEGLSPDEEFTARASAFDVSLAPDEGLRGVGAAGVTANRPGTVTTDDGDSLIAADLKRTRREDAAESAGVFDMGGGLPDPQENDLFETAVDEFGDDVGLFSDDRERQGSLDVGFDAGVTEDRSGQIAGSANFADERDGLMPDQDIGEQSGLFEMETDVGGDGQMDLFGDNASKTKGAEYRF